MSWAGPAALFLALILVPAARAWRGILDAEERDASGRAMPRTGGPALLVAWAAPVLMVEGASSMPLVAMAAAAFGLGLYDDLRDSSPRARTVLLAGLALLAAWWCGGVEAVSLWGIGTVTVGAAGVPLAAAVILATNVGFDFVDGLDGLAGGLALVAAGGLVAVGGGPALAALAAATAGFLVFNRPRASIYMGDSGSNLLGFVLGVGLVQHARAGDGAFAVLPALLLVVVPALDTALALLRRTRSGAGLFAGDQEHMHHRLANRFGPTGALAVLLGGALLAAAVAVLLLRG